MHDYVQNSDCSKHQVVDCIMFVNLALNPVKNHVANPATVIAEIASTNHASASARTSVLSIPPRPLPLLLDRGV